MELGQFVKYKGYIGSIEYSPDDAIYYGRLLYVKDFILYDADNVIELYVHYREAVDDYIEFKKRSTRYEI